MLVVVEDVNAAEHRELLENMFRLRARVFRDRLKWDVAVVDGMERDRYDEEGPVYLIYTDQEQKIVKGSLRLLPTTGPTLLAEFFSDTMPAAAKLSAPSIWECTRFCLDETLLDNGSREEMAFASGVLFAGLLFGALKAAGPTMQVADVSPDVLGVLQGLIVLFIAAPPLVRAIFRFIPLPRGGVQ